MYWDKETLKMGGGGSAIFQWECLDMILIFHWNLIICLFLIFNSNSKKNIIEYTLDNVS